MPQPPGQPHQTALRRQRFLHHRQGDDRQRCFFRQAVGQQGGPRMGEGFRRLEAHHVGGPRPGEDHRLRQAGRAPGDHPPISGDQLDLHAGAGQRRAGLRVSRPAQAQHLGGGRAVAGGGGQWPEGRCGGQQIAGQGGGRGPILLRRNAQHLAGVDQPGGQVTIGGLQRGDAHAKTRGDAGQRIALRDGVVERGGRGRRGGGGGGRAGRDRGRGCRAGGAGGGQRRSQRAQDERRLSGGGGFEGQRGQCGSAGSHHPDEHTERGDLTQTPAAHSGFYPSLSNGQCVISRIIARSPERRNRHPLRLPDEFPDVRVTARLPGARSLGEPF